MKKHSFFRRFRALNLWFFLFASGFPSTAHEDLHTHPALTIGAFLFLDQAAPEDAAFFSATNRSRARQGSIDEDTCPYFVSHFYNPQTGENTTPIPPFGIGLGCELGSFDQQTAPARATNYWSDAVNNYRGGDTNLAMTQLGHVFHLLQDMSSPAHVHNDVHGERDEVGCQDTDDFENWGWSNCSDHGAAFSHVFDYLTNTVANDYMSTNQIRSGLALGLRKIFGDRPQRAAPLTGKNAGYSFVHELATRVYDFTTFKVVLKDTGALFSNDRGADELNTMFGVWEFPGASGGWYFEDSLGYDSWSQGECESGRGDQAWWLMDDGRCQARSCPDQWNCTIDEGYAYIENTGGGSGGGAEIPDTLVPAYYDRPWFRQRYDAPSSGRNVGNVTMLRIYGDVLYSAAVAYGAGLLQTFLDEAVMPQPITGLPTIKDGATVWLVGHANPGGTNAVAWLEWSPVGGPTNRLSQQDLGAGTDWVNVTAPIQGLTPDTSYQYRLVSSNRFGVRYGTNQIFRTPAFVLAGNGLNAWQITDNSGSGGSSLRYVTNLLATQRGLATSNGWKLAVTSRFVTDFGGTKAMTISYTENGRRFLFCLDLDPSGDLELTLDGPITRKLTTNGVGATDYHTHEVQFANGKATYRFDGTIVTIPNWIGIPTIAEFPTGQISWGATSSPGRGQMNFNRIEFSIGGSNVVGSYNAGMAGSPAEAPDPVSQGWTRLDGATPIPEGPLSPDGEPSLVLAETLAASGLSLQGAQLNGRVDPRGRPAAIWFEWGLNASYGNVAALTSVPGTIGWTNVSAQLGALTQETTYHYRIVASNSFGIRFGTNRTFTTSSFLLTGAAPNAWQITDSSTASGSTFTYRTNLPLAQRLAATNAGWRLTVASRITPNFAGPRTMTFYYDHGATRFLVWMDLDANGNLTAELEGQTPRLVATATATNYHVHELVYNPTNRTAAYWFDGNFVTNWSGAPGNVAGEVAWGAGSSPGSGQMNYHVAEFAIVGLGFAATYQAGTSGNPVAAPNPISQGWTPHAGSVATSAPVSPDAVAFQPIADAETLPASGIGPNVAQFNAMVNTRAQPTTVWFEWGTTAAFGHRTTAQNLIVASGAKLLSQGISGLAVDTLYYYRVVASNAFVVSFGSHQSFRTGWFLDSGMALAAVDVGSVAWGDYDNDGDLDLIITGQADTNQVAELYHNEGGTNFVPVASGLPAVNQSAVAWGDYDKDGYLDLALSGWRASGAVSRVYRNARDGTFVDANVGLPGLRWSSVTWSDFDNDGDLDLLLTGLDDATTNALTRLYRNEGGTNFVDSNAGLPGVAQGAVAWEDFDGDGDQDLVLTGRDNSQIPISRIYRNVGDGIFSDIGAELPGVEASSVAWGDFDNDGDPDLLLTGWTGGTYTTHLLRNERNGAQSSFLDIEANLPGASASSVGWGDYDGDGDLDIVLTGWTGNYSARIYRNDSGQNFAEIGADLVGVNWSSAAWADYDNDNDLDLLVTGSIEGGRVCRLYRNGASAINARPTAPSGLSGSGVGNVATVSWNSSDDDTTPASTLSYNVVLAAETGGVTLSSPMADLTNGYRRVVRPGNAGQNQGWTFKGLRPGTYHFTVQAIDSSFAGGPFAPWQAIEIAPLPVGILATEIPLPGQFRLHISAAAGAACEVFRSPDLANWSSIGLAVEILPGRFEFLDGAAPANGAFYQIRAIAP
jgi:hypothetical protein